MIILLQLILYCLLFFLLVKCAARNNGLNCPIPVASAAPACMLQAVFQSFLVTAGRPGLGLALMIGAGISNMVLDYVLIVPCQMGIAGAALAVTRND